MFSNTLYRDLHGVKGRALIDLILMHTNERDFYPVCFDPFVTIFIHNSILSP